MKPKKPKDISIDFVEALKKSWVATVDAIPDPLLEVDAEYNVIRCNKALSQWSSRPIKKILGEKCFKILADRKSPCPNCPVKTWNQNKDYPQSFNLEEIKDHRYLEVSSRKIEENPSTKRQSFVHVYRDRTDTRSKEQKWLQTEKLASIGLLAGGLSHEINNPLGGIIVFAQMLQRNLEKTSPHQEDVKEILAAAKRCKDIVAGMLDFSRTSSSTNQDQEAHIEEAIDSAWRFAKMDLQSKKIKFTKNLDSNHLHLGMNHNKLIQLFLNLFQNAIHAMPKGGFLKISTESDLKNKNFLKIVIKDSGSGIEKENIKKIFDPFFTTKQPGKGTGLGLAVCYALVKEVNGDILVKSTKHKGSTFEIHLPLHVSSFHQQSA